MAITFATNDEVWQLAEDTTRRTGLAGQGEGLDKPGELCLPLDAYL